MENILQAKLDNTLSATHSAFSCTQSSRHDNGCVIGGYLANGKLCWLARGPTLSIIHHGTKKNLSYKNFTTYCLEEDSVIITTCKEYGNYLLVGMRGADNHKGFICLYSHNTGRVIKMIEMPFRVTCMEVILQQGGANLASRSYSQKLRWLFGVIAVGTEEGHIYLVDLRLDDSVAESLNYAKIETVPMAVRDIPKLRDDIYQRNGHIAFELLDQSHENQLFHYLAPDDLIIETFESCDVAITALHFEPRTKSLFVGFLFGEFQIFDLQDLTLTFSSELLKYDASLIDFAFQEPENDPKNFCYLWIVRSLPDNVLGTSSLSATMFQLMYAKKETLLQDSKQTSSYSDLEYCVIRYNLPLNPSFLGLSTFDGKSNLLQCCAIEHYLPSTRIFLEEEYCTNPCTSVFMIGWETQVDMQRSVQILLFDINNWYLAHMPGNFRAFDDDDRYLVIWKLQHVLPRSQRLLAMCSPPSALCRFKSKIHPLPDQFLQPSAYSFSAHCLFTSETVTCRMPGIQRQAVEHLVANGVECLITPDETFHKLIVVGFMEQSGKQTVEQKREVILSAALNQELFSFLSKIVLDLSSGEHAASGCTLRFVMDWAWKKVALVKESVDALCVPVFDGSTLSLDAAVISQLFFNTTQLSQLGLLFKALLKAAGDSSEQSKTELNLRIKVVELIYSYLKILRWFIGARLLPEQIEGTVLEKTEAFHFVYKQNTLKEVFARRRNEIKNLKSSPSSSLLIIDGLIDDAGEQLLSQWQKLSQNDDTALYPPPSLLALLEMFYLDDIDEVLKHSIVTYFLLDVLALEETTEDEATGSRLFEATREEHRQLVSFSPQTFQLSPATTKLMKAFWLLDHKEFQDSLAIFCEAGTKSPWLPWQHRRILQAYILQGHTNLALRYLMTQRPITSSLDDVKLHIEIYIKNKLSHHALEVARCWSEHQNQEEIYFHLFSCCHQYELLHDILKIAILRSEKGLLTKYFQTSNIPHFQDLLVLYHLKNSRHLKAIQTYRQNKPTYIMTEHDDEAKQQHKTLSHIVQGFVDVLPDVQREIALTGAKIFERNVVVRKEVFEPQPLSATLNSQRKNVPLSHSSLLAIVLNKKKELEQHPPMTPFKQKPIAETSTTSLIPAIQVEKSLFSDQNYDSPLVKTPSLLASARKSVTGRSALGEATASPLHLQKYLLPSLHGTPVDRDPVSSVIHTASLLLQTPPIKRKVKSPTSKGKDSIPMTPQSILRVKSKLLRGKSPSLPCVSQGSPVSVLPTGTGSLTTSEADDSPPDFPRFAALDSSSSSDDNVKWLMTSAEPALGASQKENNWINTLFATIATPPVKQLMKNFKGLTSKPAQEEPSGLSSTPKRLRFLGLNSTGESDDFNVTHQSLPVEDQVSNDSANEDIEVDITGGNDTDQVTGDGIDNVTGSAMKDADSSSLDPDQVASGSHGDGEGTISSDVVISTSASGDLESADVAEKISDSYVSVSEDDADLQPWADAVSESYVMSSSKNEVEDENSMNKCEVKLFLSESSDDFSVHGKDASDEELEISEDDEGESKQIVQEDLEKKDGSEEFQIVEHTKDEVPLQQSASKAPIGDLNVPEQVMATCDHATLVRTDMTLTDDREVLELVSSSDDIIAESSTGPEEKASDVDDATSHFVAPPDESMHEELVAEEEYILKPIPEHVFSKDPKILKNLPTFIDDDDDLNISDAIQRAKDRTLANDPMLSELKARYLQETSITDKVEIQTDFDENEKLLEDRPMESGLILPKLFDSEDMESLAVKEADKDAEEASLPSEIAIEAGSSTVEGALAEDTAVVLSTAATTRVQNAPVFIFSPPVTIRSSGKTEIASGSPISDLPNFVFSPVATRSGRKRHASSPRDDTPLKVARHRSVPTEQNVIGKPPLPKSAKKPRKSLPRKITRKVRKYAAGDSSTITSDSESAVMSESSVVSDSETMQQEVDETVSLTSRSTSKRKVIRRYSENEKESDKQQLTSTKKSPATSPRKNERISTQDATSAEEDISLAVAKTPTRKYSKSGTSDETQPIVTRASSRKRNRPSESQETSESENSPTVTRTSSRKRSRRSNIPQESSESENPPTITKTPSRRKNRSSKSKETNESENPPTVTRTSSRSRRNQPSASQDTSEPENPPTVTKTPSHRKNQSSKSQETSEPENPPTVTRTSSRSRRNQPSASQDTSEPENPPTVTKTPSRKKNQLSKSQETTEPENPPTVTRTSSRSRRNQPSASQDTSEPENPPTVTKTPSRRKNQSSKSQETSEPEVPPTVTRTSSRSRRNQPSALQDTSEPENPPTVTKTPSRRKNQPSASQDTSEPEVPPTVTRTSSRSRRNQPSASKDTSEPENPPTVTKTPSRRKNQSSKSQETSEPEVPPTVTKTSSRSRRNQPSASQDTSEPENPPTVTKTSSRSRRNQPSVSQETSEPEVPPTVTRTSSRSRRNQPSASKDTSEPENLLTVTKTSSRSRRNQPSVSQETSEPDVPPTVTRTSSRSRRNQPSASQDTSEPENPPTVTKTSSRSRRNQPSVSQETSEPEVPPTVTRTSSRSRRNQPSVSQETSEPEVPQTVTRTSSRKRAESSKSHDVTYIEVQPTVSRTSSKHREVSRDLEGTKKIEADSAPMVTETTSHYDRMTKSSKSDEDSSAVFQTTLLSKTSTKIKQHLSPSREKINLLSVSPSDSALTLTKDSSSVDTLMKCATRSRMVHFPITSRRRATVFSWRDKRKKK